MTMYEERFYMEFSQLVKVMKGIAADIQEIKQHMIPLAIKDTKTTNSYTYGEILKMKEEFEKTQDWLQESMRTKEERNDK